MFEHARRSSGERAGTLEPQTSKEIREHRERKEREQRFRDDETGAASKLETSLALLKPVGMLRMLDRPVLFILGLRVTA